MVADKEANGRDNNVIPDLVMVLMVLMVLTVLKKIGTFETFKTIKMVADTRNKFVVRRVPSATLGKNATDG